MSEEQKSAESLLGISQPKLEDALTTLKRKADTIGVKYPNNIGIDALREMVNEKMNPKKEEPKQATAAELDRELQMSLPLNEVTDENILRERMYKECMFLVRVRISNLNPLKKDIPGEWFTIHNKYLGTVKKYIPFGEATDNGYHVPKIILDAMKRRKFASIKTKKDTRAGTALPTMQWVKEFAIEELPYLTGEEWEQLKRQQAAAKGM